MHRVAHKFSSIKQKRHGVGLCPVPSPRGSSQQSGYTGHTKSKPVEMPRLCWNTHKVTTARPSAKRAAAPPRSCTDASVASGEHNAGAHLQQRRVEAFVKAGHAFVAPDGPHTLAQRGSHIPLNAPAVRQRPLQATHLVPFLDDVDRVRHCLHGTTFLDGIDQVRHCLRVATFLDDSAVALRQVRAGCCE